MDQHVPSRREAGPIPLDTDTSVATEAVEPPPIKLAVPGPIGTRRVSGRISVVVALTAVLAVGAVGAHGYSLTQDLNATRATLTTTDSDLAAKKSTLETTTSSLGKRTATLIGVKKDHADLNATIAGLSTEVAGQTKCVQLQTAALDELARIEQLQTENYNRTAEKSAWAKSETARSKAIGTALEDYYQAYSKAFGGATSAARTWATKGKSAEASIAAEEKKQKAELKIVDQKAGEISAALDALEKDLATADAACAEVAS
jgi:chromosome segregation ATPase